MASQSLASHSHDLKGCGGSLEDGARHPEGHQDEEAKMKKPKSSKPTKEYQ
jgi:hypothetical protein